MGRYLPAARVGGDGDELGHSPGTRIVAGDPPQLRLVEEDEEFELGPEQLL